MGSALVELLELLLGSVELVVGSVVELVELEGCDVLVDVLPVVELDVLLVDELVELDEEDELELELEDDDEEDDDEDDELLELELEDDELLELEEEDDELLELDELELEDDDEELLDEDELLELDDELEELLDEDEEELLLELEDELELLDEDVLDVVLEVVVSWSSSRIVIATVALPTTVPSGSPGRLMLTLTTSSPSTLASSMVEKATFSGPGAFSP